MFSTRRRRVFLLDYSCFLPEPDQKCSLEVSEYLVRRSRHFSHRSMEFMRDILLKSGLGNETYAPPFFFLPGLSPSLYSASLETEGSVLSAAKAVLAKTRISAARVDVLVVVTGSACPVPSLSSFLVHRLGLSPSVRTFNLSSMGCGAGAISLDLAARLLSSTRCIRYSGEDRSMLVSNCIFRAGAAVALLTNDSSTRRSAKLELLRSLRTHAGADDAAYSAAYQAEDESGNVGISLKKELVHVASEGLCDHIRALAPWVLPWLELLRCAYWETSLQERYVPDMTTAFEHLCIHTGGKAVINAVARVMRLADRDTEPARMCLHRFGNTSSSLVFYELAYFEAKGRIRMGDRVWMLGFGSGFKACSLVWRSLKDSSMDDDNPWKGCIHRYPVES
ncbi:hypothetical protein HPP92_007672 [Vanilla planifolia]|nr:hypothetical protein HPP92_007672 [Vanilla planifolia]